MEKKYFNSDPSSLCDQHEIALCRCRPDGVQSCQSLSKRGIDGGTRNALQLLTSLEALLKIERAVEPVADERDA